MGFDIGILLSDGWLYVAIYLYLFVLAFLESCKKLSTAKGVFALISMWIFSLFIGLRWETGTDWTPYKELFDSIELDWTFLLNVYHFDVGYVLFNALVRMFSDSYTVFLLINSFVTIYVLYRLIRKLSPHPNLSWYLFFSAFMIAQFMGSNRRMMAMVFLLWGFYYLFDRQKLKYLLMVGLAFLFHRSAVIALVLLFIPREMFSRWSVVVMLFAAFIVGAAQLPAKGMELLGNSLSGFLNIPLVDKMVYYSETSDQHMVKTGVAAVIQIILAVGKRSLFLLFYFYIIGRNKIDPLTGWLFNIYIIGFVGYLFFMGSFFYMLTAFFAIVEVLLVGRMFSYAKERVKIGVLFFMLFYGLFQTMSSLSAYPDLYMPYQSIFNIGIR